MRYALTFSSREMADAAAAKLTDEGLTVRLDHQVYVDASASSDDEVAEMRRRMELLGPGVRRRLPRKRHVQANRLSAPIGVAPRQGAVPEQWRKQRRYWRSPCDQRRGPCVRLPRELPDRRCCNTKAL